MAINKPKLEVDVLKLVRERFEQNGFSVDLFPERGFKPDNIDEDLITVSVIDREIDAYNKPVGRYLEPKGESIVKVIGSKSQLILHEEICLAHYYYHGTWDVDIRHNEVIGRLNGLFVDKPLAYKDLRLNLIGTKQMKDGFIGWVELKFKFDYILAKIAEPDREMEMAKRAMNGPAPKAKKTGGKK